MPVHHSIKKLHELLKTKQISSFELTQSFLQRIKQFDPAINSFITIAEEQALQDAKHADAQIAQGNMTELTGIPIAHKDLFCTQGIKTTCGSKMLHNFAAPYDATVVTRFKQAGCVMLGKTNLDEFGMGSSNENSSFGSVKNPWNLEYVAGGSSGGSAASVAAYLTPATTGTDTGGSVRLPAAFCGITGLKPTYGRSSRWGMIAYASSLDSAGLMTHTAEDAALLLNAMAGFDEKDSTSATETVSDYTSTLNQSIAGLKIGLPQEYFREGLDSNIAKLIMDAAKTLEKMGATLHEVSLPMSHYAIPTYYVVALAEASSNLARYDGVRFGYRCEHPKDLTDLYERSRGEGFGSEVKRRIMLGTYVLSSGYYDAFYLKAQKIRRLISQDFQKAFQNVDVILGPTSPATAFKIGEKIQDPVNLYLSDIYTVAVNLAGLPGLSIPVGFLNQLPVGVQLIGNYFKEAQLLNIAHQYQQQTDWHLKVPQGY